jgi:hypothetical protein
VLADVVGESAADVLGRSSLVPTLVDVNEVRRLLDDHCAGRRDYSFALWALWVLARWANHRADVEPVVAAARRAPPVLY